MKPDDVNTRDSLANMEALTSVAKAILVGPTSEQVFRGEQAIRRRLAREWAPKSPWGLRLGATAALCSILVAVGVFWYYSTRVAPIRYQVENATVTTERTIVARGSQSPVLRFSDGTEIKLEPSAKARIRFLTERGATLSMDEGRLHAEVVHSSNSEWRFDVGPYVVHVTGTAFGLSWAPEQDRFDLRLEHGSVTVHAPVSNGPIPVRAGQWLTIRSRSNQILIRDLTTFEELPPSLPRAEPSMNPSPDFESPPLTPTPSLPFGAAGGPSASSLRVIELPRRWVKELRLGHLEQIVADAQQRGLETCLSTVGSDELSALADAARYTRHNDIARSALLAQRHRFAGSQKSAEAAFLLGKLAETERDSAGALRNFNIYLKEAAGGRYAGEALGRKMAIIQQSAGSASARPIATEYLSKYPSGTYAEAARAILNGP